MKNLGETKLKKRRSKSDSMKDFDKLPKLLRDWPKRSRLAMAS